MWRVEENMFLIPGVTREMINMKVKCHVTNDEGAGEKSVTIDVACKCFQFIMIMVFLFSMV